MEQRWPPIVGVRRWRSGVISTDATLFLDLSDGKITFDPLMRQTCGTLLPQLAAATRHLSSLHRLQSQSVQAWWAQSPACHGLAP